MIVLGTPCETVLLPVKVMGPLTTGFGLPGLSERKAINQKITKSTMAAGKTIHLFKDELGFFSRITGAGEGTESCIDLKSCQSLYPSTDISAWRVDGWGI